MLYGVFDRRSSLNKNTLFSNIYMLRFYIYSLAYHLACVIYLVFFDWIPLPLQSEFTMAVYLVGYVVTLLFSVLAPVIDFLVSMKSHTKTLVRW